jgi:DNA recombination protein RmuC
VWDYIIVGMLAVIIVLLTCLLLKLSKNDNTNNIDINNKLDYQLKAIEANNKSLFEKVDLRVNNLEKEINNVKDIINSFNKQLAADFSNLKTDNMEFFNKLLKDNQENNNKINDKLSLNIKEFNEQVKEKLNELAVKLQDSIDRLDKTVGNNLTSLREDNNKKLEEINVTVGEKLEKTLEGRLKQSFDNVLEQITGVNKAIGEIKGLASDVGSLKTVLTNVKTKGIVGEVILGNIIRDILTIGQYEENVITKIGSTERVEFAIKMPGVDDSYIYLPIDSKLPLESYHKIKDGMDTGNPDLIKDGRKELKSVIKKYAKDISEKYIDVPNTCDFAIMFLPIEGLYIEALNMNLFEEIQKEYKVNIAGPTTLTAILNSLQMGFKTLAIQKKSADVFKLLGAVKNEFEKFANVLEKTQKKVTEASDELDKLVGTRTRMIRSKLRDVEVLDEGETQALLKEN